MLTEQAEHEKNVYGRSGRFYNLDMLGSLQKTDLIVS